ncbi:MAG: HEPN domain-containing protein [Oscillospiraceae bacterium]|nr:HEPN domain-containing protein [Oscillospiraceae bacterium]
MSRGYRDGDSKRYFDWLYYAAIDLRVAKLILEDGRCRNMVAFHCQQSVEKALKGYLLWRKNRLYDGHNLPFLCKQAMMEDEHFRACLPLASEINHYYIESRYPADFLLSLDEETATMLIVNTTDMVHFINSLVKFDFTSYHPKKM